MIVIWKLWKFIAILQRWTDWDANGAIVDFIIANSITDSFKVQKIITGKTGNNSTKNFQIMAPLKHK